MELTTKKRPRHVEHEFTEDESFRLIAAVEKHNCLWDVTNKTYKNRRHIRGAWEQVAEELSLPQEDVIAKWSLLRQRFRNAYAKMKENGQTKNSNLPPPNIYYYAMFFLSTTLETMSAIRQSPKPKKEPAQFEFSSLSYSDDELDVNDSSFQQTLPSVTSAKRGRTSKRISARANRSVPTPTPPPSVPLPLPKRELVSHSDYEPVDVAFQQAPSPSPPKPAPPAAASHSPGSTVDRAALLHRLGRWIDEDMGSRQTRPNKYESLTTYVCNLLCNHTNRRLADEVAVEISELATKLLSD